MHPQAPSLQRCCWPVSIMTQRPWDTALILGKERFRRKMEKGRWWGAPAPRGAGRARFSIKALGDGLRSGGVCANVRDTRAAETVWGDVLGRGRHVQRPRGRTCSAGREHEEKASGAAVESRPQGWGLSDVALPPPPPRACSQQVASPGSVDTGKGPDRGHRWWGREHTCADWTGRRSLWRGPCLGPKQLKLELAKAQAWGTSNSQWCGVCLSQLTWQPRPHQPGHLRDQPATPGQWHVENRPWVQPRCAAASPRSGCPPEEGPGCWSCRDQLACLSRTVPAGRAPWPVGGSQATCCGPLP